MNPVKQVAKKHRTSQSWVCNIVSKVKKRPSLLDELAAVREEKKQLDDKVSTSIVEMYQRDEYFSSVRRIRTKLKEDYDIDIKPARLMHIMHHNMGMNDSKDYHLSILRFGIY